MTVLKEHKVYTLTPGRVVHSKDAPVADILSTGMAALAHGSSGNPIAEFNEQFNRLRERRRLIPVSNSLHTTTPTQCTASTVPSTQAPAPSPPAVFEDDLNKDEAGQSDSEDEGDVDDDEGHGEYSPTLTRMEEFDVELDMDTLELDSTSDSEDEYQSDISEEM